MAPIAALLLLLLLAASGPLRPMLSGAAPLEPVAVSLLAGAQEKGAVCLDGTPPGYHLQRGSGDGSGSWLLHLEGGGWCSTLKDCSGRRMSVLGSSNFMKPLQFAGHGIFDSDEIYNPDFYNWNKVYVRYCDGASFAGDAEGQAQDGTTVYFRGLRIYEAVIGELMEKGLANATQVLFTGCSAGGLATILHCDDFSARFPQQVSVKCFADAGFFLDVRKDISGERSFWSFYNRVVQLQNVRQVLHKDCLANKDPTECFFPTELIKSIRTPMFILNSAYDSWQIQNVLLPSSSSPEKSWLSCKDNIGNCNSTQIKVLDEIRNTMINDLKVINDKAEWGMFIDSCFTHCQTLFRISWSSPTSPRLGNKNIAKVVGDWYFGRSQGVKEIDCEYPCNPTCNSLPPP
ncbi:pectin acetylesterase 5-like isoform X1 [Triticum urartu]|uniref:pectin acetylesterase 5-like isoform X1 n=1 Tax=Triticum urartu TaxID=4572 RepID=UPI00204486CC|nr:pectin acetylesterase 5-like isoform X1 [Triticum urartu]